MIEESEGGLTGARAQIAAATGTAMNEAARDGSVAAEARAMGRILPIRLK